MLRVMTANLLNGEGRPDALARLLDEYQPDIFGAQELSANQATVIEQRFGFGVAKPSDQNDGNALMATGPIEVEILPLRFRSALRARIVFEDESVEIMAIHLANPIDTLRGRLPERRSQVNTLEPLLERPGPRIVIGDMNSTPSWPAYRRLRRHLDDPIADFAKLRETKAAKTWAYRPGYKPRLRIDHVLTVGFRATAVWTREIQGSDHYALIADLERT